METTTRPSSGTAPATWCGDCRAHGLHEGRPHPEFMVRGTVEVSADFNVDLLALVRENTDDWRRIVVGEHAGDLEECLNELVSGCTVEDGWEQPYTSQAVRWAGSWDPELDWRPKRDDTTFYARLTLALQTDALWPLDPGQEQPVPDPAVLGMEPLPFDGGAGQCP